MKGNVMEGLALFRVSTTKVPQMGNPQCVACKSAVLQTCTKSILLYTVKVNFTGLAGITMKIPPLENFPL